MLARENLMPFQAHIDLLQRFISQRDPIVERIQVILNAQQKPLPFQHDRAQLGRQFDECFFAQPVTPPELSALRGQLQRVHWANGFRPRDMPGVPNEMFDPADMMARAFNVWRNSRWPGRNGRIRYAQTLFNLHVVRSLALLCMRVCDAGPPIAAERLGLLQRVLDALWKSSPPEQPVLVRDVRWLVPVAQSPTTDELAPYFEAARRFEECLPEADQFEIHKASVLMAGGHLRSQLRHFTMQGRSLAEQTLVSSTRTSNALDCAMTIQHLVPLLAAYGQAIRAGDVDRRSELAGIICQGISADPELYVNRLDLLGAYSMIEPLFTAIGQSGQVELTATGRRHVELVRQYVELAGALTSALYEDCRQFRPASGVYSPYGVMYGFSSNILEHMTLKTLQPDAETRFSLEDVFADGGNGPQRLAWVSGWRRMPHVPQEVLKLYEYPQQFAEEVFARIETALGVRSAGPAGSPPTGRLFLDAAGVAALPAEHLRSSDPCILAAGRAQPCESAALLADRQEGMYLVSYQTAQGWVAISKNVLTEVLGAGLDVSVESLPAAAWQALVLMYPQLVAT